MSPKLSEIVMSQRLLICVGSGGVGKTTVAASLAVAAALAGRKVLVLTIDRLSCDPETRRRILENNVYRNIADSIAGSQEYMATEKLYDVVASGRYDLVVLDTPPVKNALDFLDAPGRLSRFLDKRIMKWFLEPYDEKRVFSRLMSGTSAVVFRLLGHIFGREFLQDISDFFLHFRDMYDGFRERHEAVVKMFHAPDTRFVVVCAPNEPSIEVAQFFLDEFRTRKLPGAGVIVNQVPPTSGAPLDPDEVLGSRAALGGAMVVVAVIVSELKPKAAVPA